MPHLRPRYALALLKRKLGFSPVVSIQGARQTGKSTLARDLLTGQHYVTLDRVSVKSFAESNPEVFLEEQRLEAKENTLVIDEAQKAPSLFDQIKYVVDQNRIPGQFLLLGSTEFSKELLIRESLVGRLTRIRLYPLTASETLGLPFQELPKNGFFQGRARVTRPQLIKYLHHGGYPGIFAVRDDAERAQKLEDWLTLTCERDVLLFPKLKGDPDLCRRILGALATLDEPSVSRVVQTLRSNPRKTATQFMILTQLFVIHRISPHPLGTGKPLYYLNDPSLAAVLGADFERKLETACLLEQLAQRAYSLKKSPELYYYRTSKGSRIHFIAEHDPKHVTACKIIAHEKHDLRDFEILSAFQKKFEKAGIQAQLLALGGAGGKLKNPDIVISPWEAFA